MDEQILHVTLHVDNWRLDEKRLKAVIDGATDWVRYSPDCWLLLTSDSPADWYRRLKPFVGESDELLVIPVKFDTWLGYLDQSVVSWIERHAKAKTAA